MGKKLQNSAHKYHKSVPSSWVDFVYSFIVSAFAKVCSFDDTFFEVVPSSYEGVLSHTSYRSNSKKHMLSLLELKCFPFIIMVTLLETLIIYHLIFNHFNLLCRSLDNLRSNHNTIS